MRMKRRIWISGVCCAVQLAQAAIAPYIGYAYPAGGSPGSRMTVTIGGQYLKDYTGLYFSGTKVDAENTGYFRAYEQQEITRMRNTRERLKANLDETEDDLTRKQIQYAMDQIDEGMAMVNQMRREARQNPGMAAKEQFNPQIAERLELEFQIPEKSEPGTYELRLLTAGGISNPLLFHVDRMEEFLETEPNDTPFRPESLPELPVMVNGQIMPGDVDCFRFHAEKGQTLVFRVDARSLVPYLADAVPGWFQAVLTLYDAQGREIAFNDDYLFNPDPVLIHRVLETGAYTIKIHDSIYRGRQDFVYRLSIGETPFIDGIFPLGASENSAVDISLSGVNLPRTKMKIKTGGDAPGLQKVQVEKDGLLSNIRPFRVDAIPDIHETEPNNLLSQAQQLSQGVIVNGRIEQPREADCFSFEGQQGDKLTLEVHARRIGSPLDARLMLLDEQEHLLEVSDEFVDKSYGLMTHHADARLDVKLPATGTYYVRLDDLHGKGGPQYAYRLALTERQPDFKLRVVPASLRISRKGQAVVTVHAIRSGGFDGEIELKAKNAPPGLDLQRALIAAGEDSAQMVITASDKLTSDLLALEIEGAGSIGIRTVRRPAVPAEDRMQAFLYRHLVSARQMLVQIADPDPVSVTIRRRSDGPDEVRPGSELELFAQLTRQPGVRGGLKLSLSDAPEWLTLKTKNLGGSGGRIVLEINENAEPGQTAAVVLNGTARIPKDENDPQYNPIIKFMNFEEYHFAIDAIQLKVRD
jgi:hypothetical protein